MHSYHAVGKTVNIRAKGLIFQPIQNYHVLAWLSDSADLLHVAASLRMKDSSGIIVISLMWAICCGTSVQSDNSWIWKDCRMSTY